MNRNRMQMSLRRWRLGRAMVVGLTMLGSSSMGCANSQSGGWSWGLGKAKAAREPDPYHYAYGENRGNSAYSPSNEDPAAYRPVDAKIDKGDSSNPPSDGSDPAVNEFVTRLETASNSNDPQDESASKTDKKGNPREGIPWQSNNVAKARSLDRETDDEKAIAFQPKPNEQAIPYEASPPSQPGVKRAPAVRSVGVNGTSAYSQSTQTNRNRQPIARTASSNVRAQQGMALDDLASSRDLQELIDAAKIALVNDPANPRKQLRLSLLQLANDQPKAAAQLSPALGHRQRELISQFVTSIGKVDQRFSDPLLDTDAVLASIDDLRDSIRDTAELTIPSVALCSRVQTFGIYDEISSGHLRARQVNRVIVYCEVDHFKSRHDDSSNQFRTELGSHLELFTADGRSVWSQTEDRIVDLSRQQREDFFLAQLVSFPASLSAGEYVLKVSITDLQAQKTTEAVHRFEIQ